MADHDFHTFYEPPWNRPKTYSEDEVETAYCKECGFGFQESLNDDEALSQGWLRDRGHPATCEEYIVDLIHAL